MRRYGSLINIDPSGRTSYTLVRALHDVFLSFLSHLVWYELVSKVHRNVTRKRRNIIHVHRGVGVHNPPAQKISEKLILLLNNGREEGGFFIYLF